MAALLSSGIAAAAAPSRPPNIIFILADDHLWSHEGRLDIAQNRNGERRVYSHDLFVDASLDFIERHRERPFFLYGAFTIPHAEVAVPEDSLVEYWGRWPEPRQSPGSKTYAPQTQPRAVRAAMISRLDRDIGRIVDLIDELKLGENTLIIFTSDNGPITAKPLMKRKHLAAFLVALAMHVIPHGFAADATRPNILFAIADDWGAHASAYGTPWVKTPGFDRVAREGLLFMNAYTPVAKCAPSRAIVLTGRHAWQLEEAGNHMAFFPTKFKSWPEALMEKGWFVGITGKGWGPGMANDSEGKPRLITGRPFNQRTAAPPTKATSKNDYAANFTDFLDAAPKDTPWCFWYGAHEPHRAYEFQTGVKKGGKSLAQVDHVPGYWPDNEIVRHDILDYAYEIEHVDSHLVRMLAELDKRGLLENTIVIVTGDHGMPFPRAKGYAYVDSNHVPLAIRWPGGISHPGRVLEDFVDFTDIAPTLLDVAAVPQSASGMAAITGRSWREIFESRKSGRAIAARDHVLIGKERTDAGRPNDEGYPIRGIIRDGFLYLRNYAPDRWPAGNPETGYLDTDGSPTKTFILEARRKNPADKFWALNFGRRPAEELYDLSRDPHGVENLIASPEQRLRRAALERQMIGKLEAQGDPRMFGRGEIFDRYPIAQPESRGFYERHQRGEPVKAGWVNATDFEKEPIR